MSWWIIYTRIMVLRSDAGDVAKDSNGVSLLTMLVPRTVSLAIKK